jgi:hypothetical protein
MRWRSLVDIKTSLPGDADRVSKCYGGNAERLFTVKQYYYPYNSFRSAIPLPVGALSSSGGRIF